MNEARTKEDSSKKRAIARFYTPIYGMLIFSDRLQDGLPASMKPVEYIIKN
jgi:hypothetical protein